MWKENSSPCNGVCEKDPQTNLCKNCFRTMDEIESWAYFNDNDKREVYKLIEKRREIISSYKDKVLPDLEWVS